MHFLYTIIHNSHGKPIWPMVFVPFYRRGNWDSQGSTWELLEMLVSNGIRIRNFWPDAKTHALSTGPFCPVSFLLLWFFRGLICKFGHGDREYPHFNVFSLSKSLFIGWLYGTKNKFHKVNVTQRIGLGSKVSLYLGSWNPGATWERMM